MSTYREIIGKKIKKLSSDPSEGVDGQMWYNSTTGTLRGIALSEAWISGSNMIDAIEYSAGFGIQTAAVTAGGQNGPAKDTVEEYNGSGWSAGTALPGVRSDIQQLGFGSLTAGVVAGGYNAAPGAALDTSLEYDGSSWTSGGTMPTATRGGGAAGSLTAGVIFGGQAGNSPTPIISATQEYNGTGWATNPNPMGTGRKGAGSAVNGTQTTAMAFCGQSTTPPAPYNQLTEEYDGSSWTTGGTFPAARTRAAGAGTSAAGLGFGGDTPPGSMSAVTAKYDGSSWTTVPNMGTARRAMGSAGTQAAALTFGGDANPPITNATEEFNSSTNVITAAAWAAGGTMSAPKRATFGAVNSTPTAGLSVGGYTTTYQTDSEEYNGTSWTEGNNLNTARGYGGCAGTQTAAAASGGGVSPPSGTPFPEMTNACEEYNGTSWSNNPNGLTQARERLGAGGTSTAGAFFGGYGTPPATFFGNTEEFNGTSFSEGPDMGTGASNGSYCGETAEALLWAGGQTPSSVATTQEFDGSSWTTGGAMPAAWYGQFAFGSQTNAVSGGGYNPSITTDVVGYDGSAWSTRPSTANAGANAAAFGTGSAGLRARGYTGTANSDTTEEWTGETSVVNVKDFTTS